MEIKIILSYFCILPFLSTFANVSKRKDYMTKLLKKIHLWLSLPFGLIIVCLCFSGAAMVFKQDIIQALNPQLYKVEGINKKALSADSLMKRAKAVLPDSVQARGITISSDPERSYQVNLSKPWGGALFINQYTGQVLGTKPDYAFFNVMFKLHTALLGKSTHGGPASFGETLVGVTTLLMAVILITGFVLWYPKTLRLLKSRLQVSLHRGWKRFWYDLHVSAGAYAFLFLLACALTGLTWSFDWYEKGFYSLFGGTEQSEMPVAKVDASSSASVKEDSSTVVKGENAVGATATSVQEKTMKGKAAVDGLSAASPQEKGQAVKAQAQVPRQVGKKAKKVDGTTSASQQEHKKTSEHEEMEVEKTTARHATTDATTFASPLKHKDMEGAETDATTSATQKETVDATTSATEQKKKKTTETEAVDGVTSASPKHEKKVRSKPLASSQRHAKVVAKVQKKKAGTTVTEKNPAVTTVKSVDGLSSASPSAQVSRPVSLELLQRMLETLQKKVPDYRTITVNGDASSKVVIAGWHNPAASDIYTFNPENGMLAGVQLYKDQETVQKAEDWVHAVHVGDWGGMLTKILTFLACLIGVSLPLTGYYLWIKRLLRKKGKAVKK